MDVVIYHNPECGTSRNALELIRHLGMEPTVIDYLKVGWDRDQLIGLLEAIAETERSTSLLDLSPEDAGEAAAIGELLPLRAARASARDILRDKGTPAKALGLLEPDASDDAILDAMVAHPILVNRPIVTSPLGTRLCRPSEVVLDLLPADNLKPFVKEDGEVVIDADGRRVR